MVAHHKLWRRLRVLHTRRLKFACALVGTQVGVVDTLVRTPGVGYVEFLSMELYLSCNGVGMLGNFFASRSLSLERLLIVILRSVYRRHPVFLSPAAWRAW